jgi:hypothetical protein
MKKKIGLFVLLLVVILVAMSCTENTRARVWGGKAKVELPAGQKLVNVTWKDNNSIWYLTRPMRSDETAESYTFKESSSFGVIEGTVVLVETR